MIMLVALYTLQVTGEDDDARRKRNLSEGMTMLLALYTLQVTGDDDVANAKKTSRIMLTPLVVA